MPWRSWRTSEASSAVAAGSRERASAGTRRPAPSSACAPSSRGPSWTRARGSGQLSQAKFEQPSEGIPGAPVSEPFSAVLARTVSCAREWCRLLLLRALPTRPQQPAMPKVWVFEYGRSFDWEVSALAPVFTALRQASRRPALENFCRHLSSSVPPRPPSFFSSSLPLAGFGALDGGGISGFQTLLPPLKEPRRMVDLTCSCLPQGQKPEAF